MEIFGSDSKIKLACRFKGPAHIGAFSALLIFSLCFAAGPATAGEPWNPGSSLAADHAAAFERLPKEYYLNFKYESYAVCFDCHSSSLVNAENTLDTKFRNGDRNLHFVHVNKNKGRNCINCHEVDKVGKIVFSKKVPFGKNWTLPVNVALTPTGGRCVVGCHKPKDYDREEAVKY